MIKVRLLDAAGKEVIAISMEVCRVQRMELTGIKLTRLKGDTWAYKKVCVCVSILKCVCVCVCVCENGVLNLPVLYLAFHNFWRC